MMLALAAEYDEYRDNAKKVELITTTSDAYYGSGYQDVQNRVPKIENTMADLNWAPVVSHARRATPNLRRLPRPPSVRARPLNWSDSAPDMPGARAPE